MQVTVESGQRCLGSFTGAAGRHSTYPYPTDSLHHHPPTLPSLMGVGFLSPKLELPQLHVPAASGLAGVVALWGEAGS